MDWKKIQPVYPKGNQSWIFIGRTDAEAGNSNTLATWCEELTHQKRPWCWERLKVGGEGDDTGWDGWMASLTQWTWVWVSSRSWWWTGKPGMLQSMGSQRVRHDWVTELNWITQWKNIKLYKQNENNGETPWPPSRQASGSSHYTFVYILSYTFGETITQWNLFGGQSGNTYQYVKHL